MQQVAKSIEVEAFTPTNCNCLKPEEFDTPLVIKRRGCPTGDRLHILAWPSPEQFETTIEVVEGVNLKTLKPSTSGINKHTRAPTKSKKKIDSIGNTKYGKKIFFTDVIK